MDNFNVIFLMRRSVARVPFVTPELKQFLEINLSCSSTFCLNCTDRRARAVHNFEAISLMCQREKESSCYVCNN